MHFREEILLTSQRDGAAPRRFPRYQPNVLTHSLNKASQRNLGGFVRSRGLFAPRPGGARVRLGHSSLNPPGRVIRPWTGGQAPSLLLWSGACPRISHGITGRILVPGALAIGSLRLPSLGCAGRGPATSSRYRDAGPADGALAEVIRFTGRSRTELLDFVRAGVLEQTPGRRRCELTAVNLKAWVTSSA